MNRMKKELQKLKRENQRLRKELNKNGVPVELFDEDEEEEVKPKKSKKKDTQKEGNAIAGKCPQCSNKTEEVTLGAFLYHFCIDRPTCKYRKKVR
jgi:hypothetical protein